MPKFVSQTIGTGDQSWLGSTRSISYARTETLNLAAFTPASTYYPNNFIPSGTAVAKVAGLLVPYVSAGTGGTNVLAGFLLTDVPLLLWTGQLSTQNPAVALLDNGRINTGKLPFAWVAPTASANNATTCVFI